MATNALAPGNFELLFKILRGVAWINCRYFLKNKPIRPKGSGSDFSNLRKSINSKARFQAFPMTYIELLERKRYSYNTAKTYTSLFKDFISYFEGKALMEINDLDIKKYVQSIVQNGKSESYQNQVINAVKFYYKQVLDMPQRFYEIERPIKTKPLPVVLSEQEIQRLLLNITNLKHKAILCLLYSAGLRCQEIIDLEIKDILSDRMQIHVRGAKGNKDRYTI
jgi:integrase/recombinase XerD